MTKYYDVYQKYIKMRLNELLNQTLTVDEISGALLNRRKEYRFFNKEYMAAEFICENYYRIDAAILKMYKNKKTIKMALPFKNYNLLIKTMIENDIEKSIKNSNYFREKKNKKIRIDMAELEKIHKELTGI